MPTPTTAATAPLAMADNVLDLLNQLGRLARDAQDPEAIAALQAASDAARLALNELIRIVTPHIGCNRCGGHLVVFGPDDPARRPCPGPLPVGEAPPRSSCCR